MNKKLAMEDEFQSVDLEKQLQIELGKFLKNERKKLDINQTEIAQRLGITQEYLSMIENGKRNADFYLVWRICRILHLPLSKLEEALMSDVEQNIHLKAKERAIEKCIRELLEQFGI